MHSLTECALDYDHDDRCELKPTDSRTTGQNNHSTKITWPLAYQNSDQHNHTTSPMATNVHCQRFIYVESQTLITDLPCKLFTF